MKETEIPFGAFDSELQRFEYTIPDGYTAEIVDGKVIVKKEESEDEKVRKTLLHHFEERIPLAVTWYGVKTSDIIAWLKKQKEQKSAWSEEDEQMLHKALSTIRYALSIPIDKEDEPCFVGSSTISWLKSLKDRITLTNKNDFDRGYEVGISAAKFNQWKPTDEQMDAIREAVLEMGKCNSPCNIEVFHNIKSLYEDLKKL